MDHRKRFVNDDNPISSETVCKVLVENLSATISIVQIRHGTTKKFDWKKHLLLSFTHFFNLNDKFTAKNCNFVLEKVKLLSKSHQRKPSVSQPGHPLAPSFSVTDQLRDRVRDEENVDAWRCG